MLPRGLVHSAKAKLRVRGARRSCVAEILLFSLFLAMFAAIELRAQSFSLVTGREPVTSLDGLWRFHTGDNPAWANPRFDDSSWPLIRSDESWTERGYPNYGGYAWYRFTIQVPDGSNPLALLLPGILRGCSLRGPAEVLAYLNRAMRGQVAGFFTCCAALIDADGNMTIANAGHLPPYPNSEELAVDSGLPLGIADDAEYTEKTWTLGPSDRLTFVSDGVVEARNAKGELLGFERMAPLPAKSAAEIADAAQRWGQEDDITVLTVTRVPKLEAMPA